MNEQHATLLPPGTRVRYDGSGPDNPEYGVVVHCWLNEEIDGYDCIVTFFGDAFPKEAPPVKPYVLRYSARSLVVLD